MSGAVWCSVPLRHVLTRAVDPIVIDPATEYRQVTVRLHHKGVVVRRSAAQEIKASRQYRVRAGQFILSRIDARNGATGLVPDELDGAIVSNDFWAFLDYFAGTAWFVELCRRASEGTTNRVRLQPSRFGEIAIPLPSLQEQGRIVRKLDAELRLIDDAMQKRAAMRSVADAVWRAALMATFTPSDDHFSPSRSGSELLRAQADKYASMPRLSSNNAHPHVPTIADAGPAPLPRGWVWTDLGSVLTVLADCVNDTPDFLGVPTDYLGLKAQNIKPYDLDLSQRWYVSASDYDVWNRRAVPSPGDILLTREAPVGNACILPSGLQACITQRILLLRTDNEFVSNRYILHYLNSSYFLDQIAEACRGLTTPHVRVGDASKLLVPIGSRDDQERVVKYLDLLRHKTTQLIQAQDQTRLQLEAVRIALVRDAVGGSSRDSDHAVSALASANTRLA